MTTTQMATMEKLKEVEKMAICGPRRSRANGSWETCQVCETDRKVLHHSLLDNSWRSSRWVRWSNRPSQVLGNWQRNAVCSTQMSSDCSRAAFADEVFDRYSNPCGSRWTAGVVVVGVGLDRLAVVDLPQSLDCCHLPNLQLDASSSVSFVSSSSFSYCFDWQETRRRGRVRHLSHNRNSRPTIAICSTITTSMTMAHWTIFELLLLCWFSSSRCVESSLFATPTIHSSSIFHKKGKHIY